MTAILMPQGKQQYFTNTGAPLVGGKVWTYAAGTSTPKDTYTDSGGATPNTNPVTLDARGEATIYWNGSYKVILRDSLGNEIWTQDNVIALDVPALIAATLTTLAASNGSSLIGFVQAGSSTARTVQAKLREWVSPLDYGATGNGIANDTSALNTTETTNHGRLFNGAFSTYHMTGGVNLAAGFRMLDGKITDSRTITANDNWSVVALGWDALLNNTFIPEQHPSSGGDFASGNHLVAIGCQAMQANTTGRRNTAVGSRALKGNTTGYYNTAIGSHVMESSTTAIENTCVGVQTGQSLTTGSYNTFLGMTSGNKASTGSYNTGVGYLSLGCVTAMTGNYNVGLGYRTGFSLTTGEENQFIGRDAGISVTTGARNLAIGSFSLNNVATTSDNIAIGYYALYAATNINNVAVGVEALRRVTTGYSNVGIGYKAAPQMTTANDCIVIGYQAAIAYTVGAANVFIGSSSAATAGICSNNTLVGYGTDISVSTGSNQNAFGYSAVCTADNQVQLGNGSIASFRCQVALTVVSDVRDKINMGPAPGLDFLNGIETFQARWNKRDGSNNPEQPFASLSAQNLVALQDNYRIDIGLVDATDPERLAVTHERLIPVIINAVQEVDAKNDQQAKQIIALQKRVRDLETKLAA